MALHLEEKFYPHLLTTVSGRRWLITYGMELAIVKCLNSPEYLFALGAAIGKAIEKGMQDELSAGIVHGKEGRALTDVAAHNPSAKVDYPSTLQQPRNVNFSLLAELKSNKDASVEAVMNIRHLEGPLAQNLGLHELQPNVDQLMVPIHRSSNKVVVGATALSLALDVSSFWVRRIKENIANQKSAFRDVFVPLAEPFFIVALTGTKGTSDVVPATANINTTLSITFASASSIDPISVDDYEITVLKVGMPISTGITTSVPYASENGVSRGPTHHNYGLRKDLLYSVTFITAYRHALRCMALAFLFSSGRISSVSTCLLMWAKLVDAILLSASAFLFSPLGICLMENSLKMLPQACNLRLLDDFSLPFVLLSGGRLSKLHIMPRYW
nr:hypothetical protein [Tanacetum cinerariifolium]